MAVGQNPVPLVNIKTGGKWMCIHPKMEPEVMPHGHMTAAQERRDLKKEQPGRLGGSFAQKPTGEATPDCFFPCSKPKCCPTSSRWLFAGCWLFWKPPIIRSGCVLAYNATGLWIPPSGRAVRTHCRQTPPCRTPAQRGNKR